MHKTGWWIMTVLALGVAVYGSMVLWNPDAVPFVSAREGTLRFTLIAHGVAGSLALALGPFQFLGRLRHAYPQIHRWMGRAYLLFVLTSGLTGIWLAFFTRGGVPAISGFFALSVLWLFSGTLALTRILQKDIDAHRQWVMRSYALTFGAVTLRIYLGLGTPLAGLPFNQVYGMAAWASWALNLLFVEWVLLRNFRRPGNL